MYSSAEDPLYHPVVIEYIQRFWKRIQIVDDDVDVTTTFKVAIEDSNNSTEVNKRIEVYTSNNPALALSEFKPNFYDLLLVDINMPHMNGFELCEKILVDINVRICFMSAIEIKSLNKIIKMIYILTRVVAPCSGWSSDAAFRWLKFTSAAIPIIVYHNITNSMGDYTIPICASSTTLGLFAREMTDGWWKKLLPNQKADAPCDVNPNPTRNTPIVITDSFVNISLSIRCYRSERNAIR